MFPDPFSPRWTSPLARTKGESAEPDLWPDYIYAPGLGPTGTTLRQISGSRFEQGSMQASVAWRMGKYGAYSYFDGASGNWLVGTSGAHGEVITGPFALFAMILPDTYDTTLRQYAGTGIAGSKTRIGKTTNTTKFFVRVNDLGDSDVTGDLPPANEWSAVTVRRNAAGKVDLFVRNLPPVRLFADSDQSGTFHHQCIGGRRPATTANEWKGGVGPLYIYARDVHDSQIARLHADPYRFLRPRRLTGWVPVGVGAFTLDADPGSYGLTGANADLLAHRLLNAAPGSYAVTGSAAQLLAKRVLDAAAGAYTVTGSDAELLAARVLLAGTGTYTVTGADARLEARRVLDAAPGSYAVTGFAADLVYTPLAAVFTLDAAPGSYAVTGADAGLLAHRIVDLAPGVYSITGADADLVHKLIGLYTLDAAPGEYAVAGADADLLAARKLDAAAGSYIVSGADAQLALFRRVLAEPGEYNIAGNEAALLAARKLNAEPGEYLVVGMPALLAFIRAMDLAPGSYNVTGSDAALTALRQLAADPGAYEITGAAAILWYSETPDQPPVVRLVSVALAHSRLVDVALAQSALMNVRIN